MVDTVDSITRSRMMAGIRSTNTRPELAIRKALHANGFRYRLHPSNVPGKPDLAFPRYKVAVFVNGCFWHGHDCHLFRLPATRADFWSAKITRNRQRDEDVRKQLRKTDWRVLTIWECAIRGRESIGLSNVITDVSSWLQTGAENREIRGIAHGAC
ncbi:very short patch repair endonuclease [Methylocella silvestris]|uniref:Very short patch repair endonuclease n=1 Tax=Methylocella silvestris TaxID=199596 RepID=A0A2J7TLL6_METSI|nr:very short patch repair endonuclease [Methylocella silvestris]PNG27654.1 very short patch repair endonuclease [Methylocella silvestris]